MEAKDIIKLGAIVVGIAGFLLVAMGIMNPTAFQINSHDLVLLGQTTTTQVQNIILGFILIAVGFCGFAYVKMKE